MLHDFSTFERIFASVLIYSASPAYTIVSKLTRPIGTTVFPETVEVFLQKMGLHDRKVDLQKVIQTESLGRR